MAQSSWGVLYQRTASSDESVSKYITSHKLMVDYQRDLRKTLKLFSRNRLPGSRVSRRPAFLIVGSLDDLSEAQETIAFLDKKGAFLISVKEDIDTSTPAGMLAATVLIALRRFRAAT
jgi:hypothetical protein